MSLICWVSCEYVVFKKVARESKELKKLAVDIMQEVANVKIIHEADTDGVKQDVSVLDGVNSLRKDEVVEYSDKQLLFQNCREVENDMFKIPKIV